MSRVTEPVAEEAVRLVVNGVIIAAWSASPEGLDALGAGRLLSLGYIRNRNDLHSIRVLPPTGDATHVIDATVSEEGWAAGSDERVHRASHGCGARYTLTCRPDLLARRGDPLPVPDADAFPELFRQLYDGSPSRKTTGGHHTTALTDGVRLLHLHEVVARHNGADKAIGGAILAGDDLSRLGLVTTARISGLIAEKAARTGLAWVASRSVPTTLATEVARVAGMPLVARAAGSDARTFGGEGS